MPCEGFQSGGSGEAPPPHPAKAALTRMLHCARGVRRQPGRGAWSDNRVSATGVSRPRRPWCSHGPCLLGYLGRRAPEGGRCILGSDQRRSELAPDTGEPALMCVHTCVHVCVCVAGGGVEERDRDAGACTRVHVAHRCVCLVHLAAACAFVLVCVLRLWVSVSLFVSMSTEAVCVVRGSWVLCAFLVQVLSVARGWGLCVHGLNCVRKWNMRVCG